MKEYLYEIIDDSGNTIATKLSLKDALIFVESLFDHYYEEEKISYSIIRLSETNESITVPKINPVPLTSNIYNIDNSKIKTSTLEGTAYNKTIDEMADIFCNLTDDQKDLVYFMMDKARNEN